jgi:hypothetical protein
MPPHCDSLDGPVVAAARQALEAEDVELVLPYVHVEGEEEVRRMFTTVLPVRRQTQEARAVADQLFFETVVRVHRAGEGAPYTGIKPAGLSVGRVIPLAEHSVESGSCEALAGFLGDVLRDEFTSRLEHVKLLESMKHLSLDFARKHVEAMLGFEIYAHHVYQALSAPAIHNESDLVHHH